MDTRKGECFICGAVGYTELHHIFGAGDRNASTRNNLCVNLCYECHRGNYGVHGTHGKAFMDYLHVEGQRFYETSKMLAEDMTEEQARNAFRKEFRKSYL